MMGPEPIIITFLISLRPGIGFSPTIINGHLSVLWRSFSGAGYRKKGGLSNKKVGVRFFVMYVFIL